LRNADKISLLQILAVKIRGNHWRKMLKLRAMMALRHGGVPSRQQSV